jgi:hypothetical protein
MTIDTKRYHELVAALPDDAEVRLHIDGDGCAVDLAKWSVENMPAILDRIDRLQAVAEAAKAFCGRKGAMDDIGYSLGGKELDKALARLDGGK